MSAGARARLFLHTRTGPAFLPDTQGGPARMQHLRDHRRMERWEADDARRRHMARFRSRDTAPELALRRELHRRGRRFFVDRVVSRRCRVRPDLVFPRARVAVFVDGCFWHYCDEHAHLPKANAELWRTKLLGNRRRDLRNEAVLVSEGWRVLRFWEHEDMAGAADRVEAELDRWGAIAGSAPAGRDAQSASVR